MLRNSLKTNLVLLVLIFTGHVSAQVIDEIKSTSYFTTAPSSENSVGDQFKVYDPDDARPMAVAELKKCSPQACTYFVKKIRRGVYLESGFRLEKAIVKIKEVKKIDPEIPEVPTPISNNKKWIGISYGAPLQNTTRLDFGFQNIAASRIDLGVSVGKLPGSLSGIDIEGHSLSVNAQYRFVNNILFWKVIPKITAELGMIKADLDLSSVTKIAGDTNSITNAYGLIGLSLSQQFEKVYIDIGAALSYNTLENPQVAPSGNRVSIPFADSVALLVLSLGYLF